MSKDTVGHYINGRVVADTGRAQDVYNPATGQPARRVALASRTTVEEAISAAEAAFPDWRNTTPLKRARIMFRFKDLLEQNQDKVAALMTEELGKVLHDALGEFQRGVEVVEYACGAPEFLKGEHSKNVGPAITSNQGRGLLEPSVTQFDEHFYMTIRAEDNHGYLAVSDDDMRRGVGYVQLED